MSISVTDSATSIFINQLNQSSLTTVPEIAYWIRTNGLGQLNSLIFKSYTIDETTLEIVPADFGIDEQAILAQLYLIKFYSLQATNFLGAAGVNEIVEWSEKGHTIRKLNRTEQAKTFLSLKTQAQDELGKLIGSYKINRATPKTIGGIETLVPIPNKFGINRVNE